MRSLMVIIDGLGDDPIDAFGGRTPFEYARHPNIDKLLKKGSYSEISICGRNKHLRQRFSGGKPGLYFKAAGR